MTSSTIASCPNAELRVLAVLARLPLAWTEAVACLAGLPSRTATYEVVAGLRRAGLIGAADLQVRPGRTPLLLYLTDAGIAALASARGEDTATLASQTGLRAPDLRGLVPGLPHRLACYELLVRLAATRAGPPELVAWECPWRRAVGRPGSAATVIVRLPAGAAIRWLDANGSYLLLPDPGTVPLRAYHDALVGLVLGRQAGCATPPLVIGATDHAPRAGRRSSIRWAGTPATGRRPRWSRRTTSCRSSDEEAAGSPRAPPAPCRSDSRCPVRPCASSATRSARRVGPRTPRTASVAWRSN